MKIYDTFIFFNELDLLDIRLNVLNNIVERFVIVEATRTFQNNEKPLYFEKNKDRFSKFNHKITHIIVDDMPDSCDTWSLEAHQRNAIERGLTICRPDDQILLSDLDEIPDPRMVAYAAKIPGEKAFQQSLYYYYLNNACRELSDLPWTIMTDFNKFNKPQRMRNRITDIQGAMLSGDTDVNIKLIKHGGWHFSYLGGIDAIIQKIESFAHSEFNNKIYHDTERISKAISQSIDLFGRNLSFKKVPIDDRFPSYIRYNRKRFEHLML